jgi:hypothetical protein
MQTDSDRTSPEAIARELTELATRAYGAEAVPALVAQIRDTAEAMARVGAVAFELWADEPDFLVAAERREG